MPRERIPQHEFLRPQAKSEQGAPDDGCCRLGKTVRTLFRFTRSPWLDARKNVFRLNSVVWLLSEQDSLGSHWDSGEMSAAITKGLTDHRECPFAEPFAKIGS